MQRREDIGVPPSLALPRRPIPRPDAEARRPRAQREQRREPHQPRRADPPGRQRTARHGQPQRGGFERRHLLDPDRHARHHPCREHRPRPGRRRAPRFRQQQQRGQSDEGGEEQLRIGRESARQGGIGGIDQPRRQRRARPDAEPPRQRMQQAGCRRHGRDTRQPQRDDRIAEQRKRRHEQRRPAGRVHVPHRQIRPAALEPSLRLDQVEPLIRVEHRGREAWRAQQKREPEEGQRRPARPVASPRAARLPRAAPSGARHLHSARRSAALPGMGTHRGRIGSYPRCHATETGRRRHAVE